MMTVIMGSAVAEEPRNTVLLIRIAVLSTPYVDARRPIVTALSLSVGLSQW